MSLMRELFSAPIVGPGVVGDRPIGNTLANPLVVGPGVHEKGKGWEDQPRTPAGSPEGGQWGEGGGGSSAGVEKPMGASLPTRPAVAKPPAVPASQPSASETPKAIDDYQGWTAQHGGPKVAKEHIEDVKYYQRNGYIGINNVLRRGGGEVPTGDLGKTVAALDESLRQAAPLKESVTVFRGMATMPEGLTEGAVIADKAFVSTTASSKVVKDFLGKSDTPVEMRITLPKGERVLSMVHATGVKKFAKEQEILLPRNTKFRVSKVETSGGKTIAHLEYLGAAA